MCRPGRRALGMGGVYAAYGGAALGHREEGWGVCDDP